MKKKRTKDQQIKHLKATIGGLIKALRWAHYHEYDQHRRCLEVQEQLNKLVARVGPDLLKQEGEELRAMAYRNGVLLQSLPHWAQKQ